MSSITARFAGVAMAPGARHLPGLLVMHLRAAEQHVLVVVGEADLATAGQLLGHLIDALALQPPSLLVDLAGLDFCDLSGLDALHDATRQAEADGVPMTFRGMPPQLALLHRTFPPRNTSPSVAPQIRARASAPASDADRAPGPATSSRDDRSAGPGGERPE